jgi:PRTRC genetic system protein A
MNTSPFIRALLAESLPLPPVAALKEYVLGGNGLFVRAADSRLEALIPVAYAHLPGLVELEPYARLFIPRIPSAWLHSVYNGALNHLPDEVLYQFGYSPNVPDDANTLGCWRCVRPVQDADSMSVAFADFGQAVIDLHSHGHANAFFSSTDDQDEGGLRFYVVVGHIGQSQPTITARIGVYGHHWPVPVTTIFDGLGPFHPVTYASVIARSALGDEAISAVRARVRYIGAVEDQSDFDDSPATCSVCGQELDSVDCDRCGGDGFVEYMDAPDTWGEDCPSEENHLVTCQDCRGNCG